jgi:phosphoglycerate dehydrogenase-like enzyme
VLYSQDAGQKPDKLLQESDFIVLSLPLTDVTYHMIGERELKMMKPTAFLINMARGPIVDEKALIQALNDGEIAGAGLDTFEQEPLPAESPIWDTPNVLITPHFTPPMPDRTARSLDIIAENVRRYCSGEEMLNMLTERDIFTK